MMKHLGQETVEDREEETEERKVEKVSGSSSACSRSVRQLVLSWLFSYFCTIETWKVSDCCTDHTEGKTAKT